MYKNRTIIIVIILALVCASVIGFVTSYIINNVKSSNKPEHITLSMVGFTYSEAQMQPLIEQYERQNPLVSIIYTQIDQSTYRDFLIERFHSGNTSITPDIFEAQSSDEDALLSYTHAAPLSLIKASSFSNTYFPLYTRGLIYNNTYVLGLPENMQPLILVANTNLLQQAGYTLTNFTSDSNSFNTNITSLAKKHPTIAAINIGEPNNITVASDILQLFMLQNQTQMNSAHNTNIATFNSTQGIGAVKYYQSFISGDYIDNWQTIQQETDISAFAKGKVAMIFAYPDELPQIQSIGGSFPLSYGIYPSLVSPQTLAKYNYITAYSKTADPEQAWNFISFLNQPTNLATLGKDLTPINGYGIIFPRQDMSINLSDTAFTHILNTIRPLARDWNSSDALTVQKTFTNLLNNFLQGANPQASIDLAASQINTSIQKELKM